MPGECQYNACKLTPSTSNPSLTHRHIEFTDYSPIPLRSVRGLVIDYTSTTSDDDVVVVVFVDVYDTDSAKE